MSMNEIINELYKDGVRPTIKIGGFELPIVISNITDRLDCLPEITCNLLSVDTRPYTQYYFRNGEGISISQLGSFNVNPFAIEKVIYNGPATIVMWGDGTKTVVKCTENDAFDPEKGLAMAISKKALGNDFKEVKKWANTYEEPVRIRFDKAMVDSGTLAKKMSENLSKLHNALLRRRGDLNL